MQVHAVFWSSESVNGALPSWTDVEPTSSTVLLLDRKLHNADLPADIILCSWFTQIQGAVEAGCPCLYLEQGHEHLFGDPARHTYLDWIFHFSMRLPVAIAGVSYVVHRILMHQFDRFSRLVPNAVCTERFFPRKDKDSRQRRRILLVGNPNLAIKGFDTAAATLRLVKERVAADVTAICQQEPFGPLATAFCELDVHFVIDPPQSEIPAIYRNSVRLTQ